MNLAQVEAYLQDDTPVLRRPKPLAHWCAKPVDPRSWEPLSKLKRMFPVEFPMQVRRLEGRKGGVEVNGVEYPSLIAAAKAVGVHRETMGRWANTAMRRGFKR